MWRATTHEFDNELLELRHRKKGRHVDALVASGADVRPGSEWREALTIKQQGYLNRYEALWRQRHGTDAEHSPECVFDLGDTPEYKGISKSSVLPTIRRRSAAWWSPQRKRWMLPREKAAGMGFPVYEDLAWRAQVQVDHLTVEHPAAIGNAMHVANVGVVLLAVLCAAEWG